MPASCLFFLILLILLILSIYCLCLFVLQLILANCRNTVGEKECQNQEPDNQAIADEDAGRVRPKITEQKVD
jgi:hypothetical protein